VLNTNQAEPRAYTATSRSFSSASESQSHSHSAHAVQTLPTPLNNFSFAFAARAPLLPYPSILTIRSPHQRVVASHPKPCPQALGMPQSPSSTQVDKTKEKHFSTPQPECGPTRAFNFFAECNSHHPWPMARGPDAHASHLHKVLGSGPGCRRCDWCSLKPLEVPMRMEPLSGVDGLGSVVVLLFRSRAEDAVGLRRRWSRGSFEIREYEVFWGLC
jgi:hypothetical protein